MHTWPQEMQVFEQMATPGALYQQFYKWGLELQHKAVQSLRDGDPTAEQCITHLNALLEACPAGAERAGVVLYAPSTPSAVYTCMMVQVAYADTCSMQWGVSCSAMIAQRVCPVLPFSTHVLLFSAVIL
jgi:hypothetical protein